MRNIAIVPAYNESPNIKKLIDSMFSHNLFDVIDVLFLNDGSTDNTLEILKENSVNYLSSEVNQGVSATYSMGISYAVKNKYDNIIFFDSDGQHLVSDLIKIINEIDGKSVVLGNRFGSHSTEMAPSNKISSNYFASSLLSEICGMRLKDVSCGLKSAPVSLLNDIPQGEKYSFVYSLIIESVNRNIHLKYCDIEMKYFVDEPWTTRGDEIISLIDSVRDFSTEKHNEKMKRIISNVMNCISFSTMIDNTTFYFHSINDTNDYLIQTDIKNAKNYFDM